MRPVSSLSPAEPGHTPAPGCSWLSVWGHGCPHLFFLAGACLAAVLGWRAHADIQTNKQAEFRHEVERLTAEMVRRSHPSQSDGGGRI